jgi:asparagine synthase (glutamine-hydrolysing)
MSAVGGIINFSGAPVDAELLAQLADNLRAYGPDGGSELLHDSVGIVYRAFHTNLESRLERQPVVDQSGCILAWDGRLDNREELISLLHDELGVDCSDSSIVMAAYHRWGLAFPQRIIGDFAFSLWDPKSRTLLLARDPVGARLLFYYVDTSTVVWASRLEPLLAFPGIRLEVNDEYVAGYLSLHPGEGLTPYKSIHAVPPAHLAIVRDGKVVCWRFWGLDPNKEIRYHTDREYEEHFLDLFSEAVRTRLRADGPVWADLSGGLDSSSVVCIADEVMKGGAVQASSLETVSAVFDESSKSDERKFISIVEQKRGQQGHHFCESQYPLLSASAFEGLRPIPNPLEMFGAYHKVVRTTMHEQGARVLLAGIGGDELLTSAPDPSPELADLLVQGKLRDLHQRSQAWSLALKKPYLDVLLSSSVIPALPRRLQRLHKRRQRAKRFSLLQPRFVKDFDLYDRLLGPKDIFGCPLPSSRGQASAFLSVRNVICSGHLLAWGPVAITFPFTHRPLVEFLQATPPTQWVRPGQGRSLLRRALQNCLPVEIAKRKGKGSPAEAVLRAVAREWPRLRELLRSARVCDRGYVNPNTLKALIQRPDFERSPEGLFVLRISYLELWLRDLEKRSQALKQPSTFEFSSRLAGRERAVEVCS